MISLCHMTEIENKINDYISAYEISHGQHWLKRLVQMDDMLFQLAVCQAITDKTLARIREPIMDFEFDNRLSLLSRFNRPVL